MKKFKAKIFDCSGTANSIYGKMIPTLLCEQMIEEYVNHHKKDDDLMLGILNIDDPTNTNPTTNRSYNIREVSHRIDNLYINNNTLYAICTLLDTPNGRLVHEIGLKHFVIQPIYHASSEHGKFNRLSLKRLDLIEKQHRMWKEATITEYEK